MISTLTELMAEPWAMEKERCKAFLAQISRVTAAMIDDVVAKRDPKAFFGGEDANAKPKDLDIRDGVAHIPIKGTIMKTVPAWFSWFGIAATSTVAVQDQLSRAIEDDRVKSIVLDIESPGGIVKGVAELAADIKAARDLKPTYAHITDMGASAAYWLASQASSVSANTMASVGSIGVYTVVEDTSKAYDKAGIKVHVVSTHELKGAGVEGSQITEAQLADMQRMIDNYGDIFNAAVADGRGISVAKVEESATGQVWLADQAKDRGLIDAVKTADSAHSAAAGLEEDPKKVTAPLGANPEDSMAEDKANAERIAQLEREKAEIEAREKATKAALDARVAADRSALMDKHKDRVAPSARKDIEAYGAFCGDDLGKFEAYLLTLPKVAHPETTSKTPVVDQTQAPSAGSAEVGERAVAKIFNIDPAKMEKLGMVKSANSNGTFNLTDGRVVSAEEVRKLTA